MSPHEALGQRTPASRYHAAPRRMPAQRAAPEYPGHGLVRRVSNAGTVRWQRRQRLLSDTWLQDWIALEETGDGLWSIYFYDVLLARWDERDFKLRGELSPMFPVESVSDVPGCYIPALIAENLLEERLFLKPGLPFPMAFD
jgi:hypothetical protein